MESVVILVMKFDPGVLTEWWGGEFLRSWLFSSSSLPIPSDLFVGGHCVSGCGSHSSGSVRVSLLLGWVWGLFGSRVCKGWS